MPLSAANFTQNGQNTHQDHLQFFNLLTGVMTDQPVTIANYMTVGTSPNLLSIGAIQASRPGIAAAGSSLSLVSNGNEHWRIDATGNLLASSDNAYNIGAAATTRPQNIYAGTGVTAPTLTATIQVTTPQINIGASHQLAWMTSGNFDIFYMQNLVGSATGPTQGLVEIAATEAVGLYFNYSRPSATYIDSTKPWGRLFVADGSMYWQTATAGVASLSSRFTVDVNGSGTFAGQLTVQGVANFSSNVGIGGNLGINSAGGTINFGNGSYIQQYTNGSDVRLSINAITVTPGHTSTADLAVNGPTALNGNVTISGSNTLTVSTIYMNNGTIQYCQTLYGYQNAISITSGTGNLWTIAGPVSMNSTLTVSGGFAGNAGGSFNNLDLQYVRTLYGMNNSCYLTNDGTTWTCSGLFNTGSSVTVNGNLTVGASGGITVTGYNLILNSNAVAGQNGIVTAQGGGLYLRSGSGNVFFDSGSVYITAGNLSANSITTPNWAAIPTVYWNTGAGGPFIQGAGNAIRYTTPGANVNSFENGAGGFSPLQGAAFNVVSARRYKDNIVPLDGCLARVLDPRVTPVSFMLKSEPDEVQIGFIAEDMVQVVPEVVGLHYETGDINSINYGALVSVLWGAVRALNDRIEVLEHAA